MSARLTTSICQEMTRRQWMQHQVGGLAALAVLPSERRRVARTDIPVLPFDGAHVAAARIDPSPWQVLAQQAVDAARSLGAQYADARLTRIVQQEYKWGAGMIGHDESIGVGVRALIDGSWGFAASVVPATEEVVRLARVAIAQARGHSQTSPAPVDLGTIPVARGEWVTPHRIDPFTVPIDEKEDFINYWTAEAQRAGIPFFIKGVGSWLRFARQERVTATSEGALFTQTVYESGGYMLLQLASKSQNLMDQVGDLVGQGTGPKVLVRDVGLAGAGWERLLDAKIVEQFPKLREEARELAAAGSKQSQVGKYTLVCDGATMAALVEGTLGVATQLDRALGSEANAGGTSFITDPLETVGHLQVAAPLVTITANRSAPQELATIRWDDEGVTPNPFTLIRNGVLVDFQTTREQAAWLAPYYERNHIRTESRGCAASEDAHALPLQMMPNLALEPSPTAVGLLDLIANVKDGILVENGVIGEIDSQLSTGTLEVDTDGRMGKLGRMREIRNGRLGRVITGGGGAVRFSSRDLWTHVQAIGGVSTQDVVGWTQYEGLHDWGMVRTVLAHLGYGISGGEVAKGQPMQRTSHSVRAVAAVLLDQPVINPMKKA